MNERDTSQSFSERYSERFYYVCLETARAVGKDTGDTLEVRQIKTHAEGNGYDEQRIASLLQTAGVTADVVRVPERHEATRPGVQAGDDVGGTPESATGQARETESTTNSQPEPLDEPVDDHYRLHEPVADSTAAVHDERYLRSGKPLTAWKAVKSYLQRRQGEKVSAEKHGYHKARNWRARRRYAQGKEMDRQLLNEYGFPTTALLSLRVSPGKKSRLTLLNRMKDAIDATIEQLSYRLQRASGAPFASDRWEYFAVVAGTRGRATPHLHIMVYCDGWVEKSLFEPVVEKFVEKCPDAPDSMRGNRPDQGAVRLRGIRRTGIPRMDGASEESAGATYVLRQLPHLLSVNEMALCRQLHSSTVDAWQGHAFRKSSYVVWDDEDEESTEEEISDVDPTPSPSDGLAAFV